MAAVSLRGELDDGLLDSALARADTICHRLLNSQFDPEGAYGEGGFYSLWVFRNLLHYFEARRRYDGFDYANHPRIPHIVRWLCYEMLPEGLARSNNIAESGYHLSPFAYYPGFLAWAAHRKSDGLAAWLWNHLAGPEGVDQQLTADKVSTILWQEPSVVPEPPSVHLPASQLWHQRGLYYYRTGWADAGPTDDVVFSFFSGKFRGGHAQEDQNSFTLYGYGGRWAIDHGGGPASRTSEAHAVVLIDGEGQHHTGGLIGTDGAITRNLIGGFADYIVGDASAAYTTHSEYNNNDWPFPGIDWSWGWKGANPVERADRNVVVVHGAPLPPYVVIIDDIHKDGAPHTYQWRMHTDAANAVNAAASPVTITGDSASLDLHVVHPPLSSLTLSTAAFDNQSSDPNSTIIGLTKSNATTADFAVLLYPREAGLPALTCASDTTSFGWVATASWGTGTTESARLQSRRRGF